MNNKNADKPILPSTPVINSNNPTPDIGKDRIASDRFSSPSYMQQEWPQVWRRVWNMGPRIEQLKSSGDFVTHEFGRESFIFIRDQEDQLRCFFNVCQHRGNRLIHDSGCGNRKILKCQFHAWAWNIDGTIKAVPDADTFPQLANGLPCDELDLAEIRIDCWGGWIWFNIDGKAPPLTEFLGVIPGHLAPYQMENMRLYEYNSFLWDCNWKAGCDAFNESYHFRGIHPQMLKWSEAKASIELLGEHSRMINRYGTTSPPYHNDTEIFPELKQWMSFYGMDPEAYQGKPEDVRLAKQKYSREMQDTSHYPYQQLRDDQLSDVYHYFVFPNIVFNTFAEGINTFRFRPHATDPNKMYYDLLLLAHIPADQEVKPVHRTHNTRVQYSDVFQVPQPTIITDVMQQDADNLQFVQAGLSSEGFKGMYLGDQELRLRHFHNTLDKYMDDPLTAD
ncbi:SRPBCC family protein [Oceanicoccus sp. KOV_DT_Chl]|uniref:aromatic ring-hydroxylating oxygenase subunit alpha n=1 Tax=Oceanicoccus sp. KOV_DT_Chl TaxID=1904639 RepID=UPI000C7AA79E|nr:aromatic ring-hydroxylating dioxygenase subunit alpha [Oceanicoccus sp. KOV_DT_Chl]